MACASAACASTAANATVEVSNATSTSGDLGDPLLSLARDPSLPRELRARVRAASRELADAGLATLAATALETYGGAAEVRRGDPTRPTPRYRNTHHSPSPPPSPTPQAARHLAAVRAAVTTACGSERGTWDDADDRPESEPEPGAVVSRPASPAAADLPLPKTVSRLARNLAKLFSWLAEEHDARLSRAPGVTPDHLSSLADHLRESDVVLGRFFDAQKLASVSFSCFRREGYVTRSVVSRGAIALPFDALVRAARAWYVREIERCGLADRERDFERSRTRAVDGSSSTSAALAKFARAAESCRRAGTGGVFDGVFDERNAAAAAELAELRAHYAAMDVALTAAVEREDCLAARKPTRRRDDASDGENDDASDGENDDASDENAFRESVSATETNASSHSFDSLLPALDPETDERRGGRLATGALTLSFLVGAAEDVVATRGGCAAAVDAPVGSYYPVRAYDRVAQEMARCGLDGVSREWLAREWGPAGGSHAFAATLDEFQAAADACVSESGSKSGTYRDARRHAVRADGARLRSIAEHFRRAESALLGCRGGRRAYSAAGRLADTLEGFRDVLEAGGCLYDESPAGNAVEPSQENAVEPSQAARRAREADSESESVSVDADESVSVDADESVSVDADESVSVDADSNGASSGLSAWGAMGVGALAGAVVVAVAWAVNRACGGGGGGAREKADAHTRAKRGRRRRRRRFGEFGGWFRSAILPPPRGWFRRGPSARRGSRSGFRSGFRSRRFAATVLDPRGSRPGRVALLQTRDSETQSLHLRARGGNQTAPRGGRRRERGRGRSHGHARRIAKAQTREGGGVSRGHRCADRVATRVGRIGLERTERASRDGFGNLAARRRRSARVLMRGM